MTLRLRLIILLSILFLLVTAGAAIALFSNTRANVGAESRAALSLVSSLVPPAEQGFALAPATIDAIARTRHLRVEAAGPAISPTAGERPAKSPAWFARIVSPADLAPPIEFRTTEDANGKSAVLVYAAPDDEIGEAWEDLADSATFALMLLVVLNIGTGLIVGRELAPLNTLNQALRRVEEGELDIRMPNATLPEIDQLSQGFNRMAAALAEARRTNRELTRRIIGMQESERRSLARELHDEFGQHLTAIRADAAAMLAPNANTATARLSGRAIEETGATLMRLLRSMLERLRPEALDALGLCAALEDLVAAFRSRNPDVVMTLDLPESVELVEEQAIALYRVAQEALTNISRHAGARRVLISLIRQNALCLCIRDDGCGMSLPDRRRGFGLAGMRERIEGCGGRIEVSSGIDGRGTSICATIELSPP